MSITRPDYRQIANIESNVERSTLTNAVYQRTIVAELPLWTPESILLKATHGGDPYPNSFCFDDVTNELFVSLHGNATDGGAIFVYDVVPGSRTWPLKTVFYAGEQLGETMVIRRIGANRYLYALNSAVTATSRVFRIDITTLPAKYAVAGGKTEYPAVQGFTQLAFDGDTWAVQSRRIFKGNAQRYVFDLWDADLTTKVGEVDVNWSVGGTLAAPYNEVRQKTQGVAIHNGNYVFGVGGDYVTGSHDPDDAYLHQGLVICGADGRRIAAGLCRPDEFISIRDTDPNGLSYSGTMTENEGVAIYNDELYGLWVCTNPSAADDPGREGQGFMITRELAQDRKRIDFRPASRMVSTWDPERYGTVVHQPVAAPINPLTGESMDSFFKLCTFMEDAGVSQMKFFGVGSLLDLNSVAVNVGAMFVEILNGNGSTFLITITSLFPASCRTFWISGGVTVQTELTDDRYS